MRGRRTTGRTCAAGCAPRGCTTSTSHRSGAAADPYIRFIGRPRAKILLLGTFHFHNPGHDAHKPTFTLDVFSERRQREIADVAERLAGFGATKVAVEPEWRYQADVDRYYGAYLRGQLEQEPDCWLTPANEIVQLGFRLAQRLGHQRVYCVGARERHYEPLPDPEAYARQHGQEHLLNQWRPRFFRLWDHHDAQMAAFTLEQMLLGMNTEVSILRGHGSYLVDAFKIGGPGEYPGVDRVTGWYNRNLRIFANLQRITEREDERVLLVIGAGHLPILRQCVRASPEYKLVEAHKYLDGGAAPER
jgi:hypothetical protein